MLSSDRIVLAPTVTKFASTVMDFDGLESAISHMAAEDAAETIGTPLNNLTARVAAGNSTGDDLAEFAGRHCYRSWNKGRDSAEYHSNIIEQRHGSIYEHASVSFQITGVSRSLTHELVRHRVGTAFSQESQRYVDAKDIRFVMPPLLIEVLRGADQSSWHQYSPYRTWSNACSQDLIDYEQFQKDLLNHYPGGFAATPGNVGLKKRINEAARSLLPNAAETRMIFTCNLRELRHLLTLRGSTAADLEIRRMALAMLGEVRPFAPHFFDDLQVDTAADGRSCVTNDKARI